MFKIVNTYQVTTEDGVFEVIEQDNGIKVETLIEPSALFFEKRANEPPPPTPGPSETGILGRQLVEKDLQILELQQENQTLGQSLVDMDLRLLMGGL